MNHVYPSPGFTYALSTDPYDGWLKIGRSASDPWARLKSCQTGNPRPLIVRAVWEVDVEHALHQHLNAVRGMGEWFALPLDFAEDMVRWKARPEPWIMLLGRWHITQIRGAAGLTQGAHDLETLARAFMTRASGGRRYATAEARQVWEMSDEDRAALVNGDELEIRYVGEILGCEPVGRVVHFAPRAEQAS